MSEERMFSWKFKWMASAVVLSLFLLVDRYVASYATVVRDGSLMRVICIGRVVDVDSGDLIRFQGGSVRVGRVLETDMEGNLHFLDKSGEVLRLRQGTDSGDVARVEDRLDQILTMRILTWPRELRRQGSNFRGQFVYVGNTFAGRPFLDRVIRLNEKLFLDVPMKRPDRLERADAREYFRNTFLVRLCGLLCVAFILVGGMKGVQTILAQAAAIAVMLLVFLPGLLGNVSKAAWNAAWLFAVLIFLLGLGHLTRSLWDFDGREARKRGRKEGRRGEGVSDSRSSGLPGFFASSHFGPSSLLPGFRASRLLLWAGAGLGGGAVAWVLIRGIGKHPLPFALFIALVVTLLTFTVITGFSPKVISGSLGTVGGLAACALISYLASRLLWFTGLASELGFLDLGTVLWRNPVSTHWPYLELLTAGLIIAALGAMMDVSMSVSSTIYEVKRANPNIGVFSAMKAGYNVGKDIMSTMTDTLIFAFIGADLVFIVMPGLVFPQGGRLYPFMRMLNEEETAVAAIHALMGTLGLVLAIPISAFIAGLLTARFPVRHAYAAEPTHEEERDA